MKKSTAVQSQRVTRHGAEYWAQAFGLLLTIALVSPAPAQPLPQVEGFIFDSGEIEAVSISEGSINTAAPEPAPAAYSDRQAIANHRKAAPLFGMETEPFAAAAVSGKWSRARAEIARELDIVARCHGSGACPPDARKLIALSAAGAGRDSRAKIGLINRAVDLAIRPVSDDAQWGVPDHWSPSFETLQLSRGDCEDYAIVKYLALLEAGISKDDVKIVIFEERVPA